MVRNVTGGNKAKGQARKSSGRQNTALRLSLDEDWELYAQVTRMLGNGMCHVVCVNDGVTRLCHIRGKFRGHNKKDNVIKNGSWLLVGIRDFESSADKAKMPKCDLLEVYSDLEKERLKTAVKIDWSIFLANDNKNANLEETTDDAFTFTDNKTDEYQELLVKNATKITDVDQVVLEDDFEINVDDI
jgi:initiation factor 1A